MKGTFHSFVAFLALSDDIKATHVSFSKSLKRAVQRVDKDLPFPSVLLECLRASLSFALRLAKVSENVVPIFSIKQSSLTYSLF